ncbi:hypothetical protein DFH29DRAFT_883511 [Suillus ampliporus]|nr:hypothetical protein DFH29DRAFT_883511 [Suillus ampliporus]
MTVLRPSAGNDGEYLQDAQKSEDHAPKTSKHVRFLNTAKVARSTPNLNAAAKADAQRAPPPAHPTLHEATASPPAIKQATDTHVGQLDEASQELGIDLNDGGIYLTFDPEWRSSIRKKTFDYTELHILTTHSYIFTRLAT